MAYYIISYTIFYLIIYYLLSTPRKVAEGWVDHFSRRSLPIIYPCPRKVSPARRKVRKDSGDHTSTKSGWFLQTFKSLDASNVPHKNMFCVEVM